MSVPVGLQVGRGNPEFAALQAALADGDDARATELVALLQSRELTREERTALDGARKVLRGRELVGALEFALVSEELPERVGLYTLVLVARNRGASAVVLALPPADLRRQRATLDGRGAEGVEFDSKLCTVFSGLELAAGREQRFELLEYELPLGRAVAVRERWRLLARSGEVRCDGERFPAASVEITGCARERLAPALAAAPGTLEELLATLRAPRRPAAGALLAAGLGVPAEQREAALVALTPAVGELARNDPERVRALEPLLRWWTENRELGADPLAWARYLEARPALEAPRARERAQLELPDAPRAP